MGLSSETLVLRDACPIPVPDDAATGKARPRDVKIGRERQLSASATFFMSVHALLTQLPRERAADWAPL